MKNNSVLCGLKLRKSLGNKSQLRRKEIGVGQSRDIVKWVGLFGQSLNKAKRGRQDERDPPSGELFQTEPFA